MSWNDGWTAMPDPSESQPRSSARAGIYWKPAGFRVGPPASPEEDQAMEHIIAKLLNEFEQGKLS